MSQSKAMSLTETISSIAVGFIINFTIQMTVLGALGVHSSALHSMWITVLFTITSFARQYGVRRYFNGLST